MALYEYKCSDCEERFELMRSMSVADESAQCPECGGADSRRLISNFASVTPGASTVSSSSTATIPMRKVGHGCGGGGCC